MECRDFQRYAATLMFECKSLDLGAVYAGMAIGSTLTAGPALYLANFNSGKIDVLDTNFKATTTAGGFADSSIPAGFAPFNIWAVNGQLYVTYAKQDAAKKNDVAGAGNGMVDIFDFNGNLVQRLTSGGALNSPWGVAVAPSGWGAFSSAVLVGNFGDGKINAFDPKAGTMLGTLDDSTGAPIVIQGLWALAFGNGASGGDVKYLLLHGGDYERHHTARTIWKCHAASAGSGRSEWCE